jgi:hypothetical protein
MYRYTYVGNTLLVNNAPYKNMFNESYNTIFLEYSFDDLRGEDNYLLGHVLPYLKSFIYLNMVFPHMYNTIHFVWFMF